MQESSGAGTVVGAQAIETYGYERTQPPLSLLNALLQSDWTG
jgi:hypothetical protein